MSKLNIEIAYNGINIKAEFGEGINVLSGYSGTGKSLLMQAIDLFCLNNNITCRLCNYNDINLNEEKIKSICSDVEVVLLDNADLYLTRGIMRSITRTAKFIIVSIKDSTEIDTAEAHVYTVVYDNLLLVVKEL